MIIIINLVKHSVTKGNFSVISDLKVANQTSHPLKLTKLKSVIQSTVKIADNQ